MHRERLGETSARASLRSGAAGWVTWPAAFADRRNPEQFLAEIESWEQEVEQVWPAVLDHLVGYAGYRTVLRIRNSSGGVQVGRGKRERWRRGV